MAKTTLGYIMVGPKIPLGINWAYYNEYFQWMVNHETELKNLDNQGYWHGLKNESERNLPRHANRSPNSAYIPARVEKIREDIINTQLTYLLGSGNFRPNESYIKNRTCYECGVNISTVGKYLSTLVREVNELLKKGGNTSFTITDEEHSALMTTVMKQQAKNFTALEIEKAQIYLPQRGRRRLMDDLYGFCPQCYQDIVKPQLGWNKNIV
tara:strand:+ start:11447 stop:12079 length:633 start_codon:yes stop_codon:yes gene_type:complete